MEFSANELITVGEILSDVARFTGEQKNKYVSKGFMISQMNKCLEELSFHTFFQEDSRTFTMPQNRILDIPPLVFNIKQIFLYSGDSCTVNNSVNVYWKNNYTHFGGQKGFSRAKLDNQRDPFYGPAYPSNIDNNPAKVFAPANPANPEAEGLDGDLFYYGEQQGKLFFSPNCSRYPKIMIKFNGIWQVDDTKPSIPRYFRDVIVDWVCERVFMAMIPENPGLYMPQADRFTRRLDRNGLRGSWMNAERLVKRLGSKQRADLDEYLARLNY